jgi:homoserine kinase type II
LGSLTKIEISEVNNLLAPLKIKVETLKDTANGITDSTFICIDKENRKYILKIYENSTVDEVKFEIEILQSLKNLKVPTVLCENIMIFKNKPVVLFSFIKGEIPKKIDINQIDKICEFIASLHNSDLKPKAKNIYSKELFLDMMSTLNVKINEYQSRFEFIKNINLSSNSLIHGDLFPDNVKFIDKNLSGVYDFAQSCYGNAYFDLAVLIVSWCFEDFEFNFVLFSQVLKTYSNRVNKGILKEEIKEYLLYACLYYSLQRFTRVNNLKDHTEYLKKFDILREIL